MMKNIYTLVLIFLSTIQGGMTQIVLTSEDVLGWIGNTYTLTEDTAKITAVSPGPAGPNQVWDFTGIEIVDGFQSTNEFLAPSETPFAEEFPEANLAQRVSATIEGEGIFVSHLYGEVTTSEYIQLGTAFRITEPFDTTQITKDRDTLSIFPMTYERAWTEVDIDTFQFGPLLNIIEDSTVNTVDAWGRVSLPMGNFECLRLREESYTKTVSQISGISLPPIFNSSISYTWISEDFSTVASMTSLDGETNFEFTEVASIGLLTGMNTIEDTVAVDTLQTALVQIVHNAADPDAEVVDIYIETSTDTIKLDDIAFRSATEFLELPAEEQIIITVAPSVSVIVDEGIASFPVTLEADSVYHVVANGLLDPNAFEGNPEGLLTGFTLLVEAGARQSATDGESVDLKVFHGATDAPNVGVNVNGDVLISGFSYQKFVGYVSVPADTYQLDVTPGGNSTFVLASYEADLTGLGGGAALVLASGFLDSVANQGGAAFDLIAALPDGTVITFPTITDTTTTSVSGTIDGLEDLKLYPNPSQRIVNLEFRLKTPKTVEINMYDMMGKAVFHNISTQSDNGAMKFSWDGSAASPGLYTLRIKVDDQVLMKKFMME